MGEVAVSDNKKPVQLEYWTTEKPDLGSYLVRFRWTMLGNENNPTWIDFEIHEVVAMPYLDGGKYGPVEFMVGDEIQEGITSNADEATPTVTGFVKWDGCTQIYFPSEPTIHVDGQEDLQSLFDCLLKVRINALEQMKTLEEYL